MKIKLQEEMGKKGKEKKEKKKKKKKNLSVAGLEPGFPSPYPNNLPDCLRMYFGQIQKTRDK
jgi:hypothetical protein